MDMTSPGLAGLRVMVVEDELLVSMLIEDTLAEQHCIVIGPFSSVAAALAAAGNAVIDMALLDVNLRGEKVYPVAEMLDRRGIPFIFLSGYGTDALPANRPAWRACSKPFTPTDLVGALSERIGSA